MKGQLIKNQVTANWLEAKAKVTFSNNNQVQKVFSTIKMRKDSIIWMNVKKLGIEAARVQITKDSVYLIDRINNQYAIKSIDFLTEKFNLPANFSTLQTLLLGNPIFFTKELIASQNQLNYQLKGKNDHLESEYWLNGVSLELTKMRINDYREKRVFTSTLGDYQVLPNEKKFSYFRNLNLTSPDTGLIDVEFSFTNVELNVPTSIRFSIPERYTKID